MVTTCSVLGCNNGLRRRLHRFLKFPLHRPELLERWLKAINRPDFVPTRASIICFTHFKPDECRISFPSFRVKLSRNAVPYYIPYYPAKKVKATAPNQTSTVEAVADARLPARTKTSTVAEVEAAADAGIPARTETSTVEAAADAGLPARTKTSTVEAAADAGLPARIETSTVEAAADAGLPARIETPTVLEVEAAAYAGLPARTESFTVEDVEAGIDQVRLLNPSYRTVYIEIIS